MSGVVRIAVAEGLARITLERPGNGNAITPELIAQFSAAVERCEGAGIRAVLLDAAGGNFCVGADLRHFASIPDDLDGELQRMATDFHAALQRFADLPVPVLAAVQGHAVGAGLGLALVADLVIAADSARFATGYVKLGLSPDAGVSYFLTLALGSRRARALLISGRTLSSSEAMAMGLVDEVVDADELGARAEQLAANLAVGPTPAFAAIKRLTRSADAAGSLGSHLAREEREIVALARDPTVSDAIRKMVAKSN